MSFKFGKRSKERLATVDTALQTVAFKAIEISLVDFSITSGYRSEEDQFRMWADEKSNANGWPRDQHFDFEGTEYVGTGRSRHQDGAAVDVCPYPVDPEWKVTSFLPIIGAFAEAARQKNIKIRWGGAWTEDAMEIRSIIDALEAIERYKSKRKHPFVDAVHIELVS